MEYAIETLEIELNKWKSVYRQNEKWMMESPDQYFSKMMDIATTKTNDLNAAITILRSNSYFA